MTLIDRFIAFVLTYVGCGAQHDKERFGEVCAPAGPAAARAWFCTPNVPKTANSSCGVVACGMLALFLASIGRTDLLVPMDRQWWERACALARRFNALRSQMTPGARLGVGCLVHVEGVGGRHWYTIVRDLGGGWFETVDGGDQDEQGYQRIKLARRHLRGVAYDETSAKPIIRWIDVGALLCGMVGGPPPSPRPIPPVPPSVPSATAVEGVDVSRFNPGIDWPSVDPAIRFAYACAMIGRGDRDPLLDHHARGIVASGRALGLYGLLYPRHGRPQDADVQACQLVAVGQEYGSTLRGAVDVERAKGLEAITGPEWAEALKRWVGAYVGATGKRAIVYVGTEMLLQYPEIASAIDPACCDLWLPAYLRTMPAPPHPFSRVTMWQRQGGGEALPAEFRGRVAGIHGDVDRDRLFGPLETLA